MQTRVSYFQDKEKFRLFVTETFSNLIQMKKEGNQPSFNNKVLEIMPEIKSYINERLNTAIKKGNFSKGKYKADDFIDQLFIEIYDHIEEVEKEDYFYLWLFKTTNKLLEDIIIEEEFDDYFFENIDDYSKLEWDEMQEKFSTDGDGDLLLIEELDDASYPHNDYTLNQVFIEDKEKAIIEKLDKELSAEKIQEHFALVLYNLPSKMRHVFELSTKPHIDLEEIALVQNSSLTEVKNLLQEAQKAFRKSFTNRFLIT